MSIDTQNALFEFAVGYLSKHRCGSLHVTWYGGESLLAKDVIFDLSLRFIDYCDANSVSYSANMISNGYLLDKKLAQRLSTDCMIKQVQITVDGTAEHHNKRRVLKSGEKNYSVILENIGECKEYMEVIVRVNIDKRNVSELSSLWQVVVENKWESNPRIFWLLFLIIQNVVI